MAQLGLDTYSLRARVTPAVLAAAPALALGIAALPVLPGIQKLWSLISVGLTTFAALTARRHGNRVQPGLWAAWGGPPTTRRLRYRGSPDPAEVTRRHRQLERVLGAGLELPTAAQEAADPAAADAAYESAVRRLIAVLRDQPGHRLVTTENRQYGFARNLLGLKPLGQVCALLVGACSFTVGAAIAAHDGWRAATPLLVPVVVAGGALLLWPQVTDAFVRPCADAYADRVMDELDRLPSG